MLYCLCFLQSSFSRRVLNRFCNICQVFIYSSRIHDPSAGIFVMAAFQDEASWRSTYWKEAILWTGTQGFALIIVFFQKEDCFKNHRKSIWNNVLRLTERSCVIIVMSSFSGSIYTCTCRFGEPCTTAVICALVLSETVEYRLGSAVQGFHVYCRVWTSHLGSQKTLNTFEHCM